MHYRSVGLKAVEESWKEANTEKCPIIKFIIGPDNIVGYLRAIVLTGDWAEGLERYGFDRG